MHFTPLLVLAAVGVSAHPSGHAHLHRQAHDKREPKPDPAVGDLVTATIMGKVVSWTNTYDGSGSPFVKNEKPAQAPAPQESEAPKPTAAAPTSVQPAPSAVPTSSGGSGDSDNKPADGSDSAPKPSPSSSPSPSPSTGSSSGGSGIGITSYTPFCDGAAPLIKRATTADIAYVGNTGAPGKWGCNMMLVANAETADQYMYTMKITNQLKGHQTCTCFNKIGPNGLIDGFFHEGPTWTMSGGATQYVAFDSNSQGGCVCNPGDTIRKTPLGQFAGTWIESDFGSGTNKGWSGADVSSIVPNNYNMEVDGARVCTSGSSSTCSTIWPGGKADNAYTGGMEHLDGVGLNIPPGKVQLDVLVGFS